MEERLKVAVSEWLRERVDAWGFAPVGRFGEAPEGHHPSLVCKDAATVIVYGKAIPRAALTSPSYNLHLLHRSYHTVYPFLDEVGFELASLIEARGYPAVQVPSYAPLVFHGMEPWGVLSLKHAAVLAGLGAFGRSDQVYHPDFGALLRLGAVVTAAALPGDEVMEGEPCPPRCNACREACPAGAFPGEEFQKMACLGHTVKHGIYHLALGDAEGLKRIEMIINTAGYNYWLACDECVKVCPLNGRNR
ncbi:MAG: hypothetical protein QME88_12035 [Actinomycetota bacterium]|nr:hypothetical protein [Actinomycetota bacterium]